MPDSPSKRPEHDALDALAISLAQGVNPTRSVAHEPPGQRQIPRRIPTVQTMVEGRGFTFSEPRVRAELRHEIDRDKVAAVHGAPDRRDLCDGHGSPAAVADRDVKNRGTDRMHLCLGNPDDDPCSVADYSVKESPSTVERCDDRRVDRKIARSPHAASVAHPAGPRSPG